MSRAARVVLALLLSAPLALGLVALGAAPSVAHEERPATFPDGTGKVPKFLGYKNTRARVVCRPNSKRLIAKLPEGKVKQRNQRLLEDCRFRHIQAAIDTVRKRNTSIYVLPGTYQEKPTRGDRRSSYCAHLGTASKAPLKSSEYIGSISSPGTAAEGEHTDHTGHADDADASGSTERAADEAGTTDPIALSYADQRACPHNLNLIAVFGDRTPKNGSISCDSKFCGIQIVGTGRKMTDVVIDNDFHKLNAIRLDRAGGAVVRNLTVQQSEFNAVYVLETDGFLLDRITARGNDEYGILAFASDHGLIQRSDAFYNGDSGIYPGSGSDLNADNSSIVPTRYAIEIRRNRSHDNTLGYSGTAGNSIWAHHNKFYDNATGIATDSLFPGHPGLPQDHARWSDNEIYSNNNNYYAKFVDTGVCAKPMEERGYIDGTVCPVIPTPVGTGVLIAGGNFNATHHNWIYDNWRYGTMQFWVPAPLRDEYDPAKLFDTSHGNQTTDNLMGIAPDGSVHHNGIDHWWDDQGGGNCWQGNTYSRGTQTDNFTVPPPSCASGGSVNTPGLPVKDAGFLSCSQYDRSDPTLRHPPGCEWFDDPAQPGAREGVTDPRPVAAPQEQGLLVGLPLLAVVGLLGTLGLVRRRRAA
ncbi:right-handed parallel beta-helix repeat-containing protein [Nocardioides sp.]|uniref:right-handed parallel beta-helix repeat-containing protein n=1 Tax=Nocardioides sp. TaxID=35761 RepID=UPI001A2C8989|nr:right-handed parallel beta-helix repeat-containing protein [Nocardioides sp.]MBJ7358641.1 right-handed parallel beta-helix repeat-containing protein [Nocardioides sp.]